MESFERTNNGVGLLLRDGPVGLSRSKILAVVDDRHENTIVLWKQNMAVLAERRVTADGEGAQVIRRVEDRRTRKAVAQLHESYLGLFAPDPRRIFLEELVKRYSDDAEGVDELAVEVA